VSKRGYTYVDRYSVGIAATEINDGALLLHIYPANNGKPIGVEIPAGQRLQLARAISDHDERTVLRVLDVCREQVHTEGANVDVPYAPLMAAIYIDPEAQVVTPELAERAREVQALIDAEKE
jgi:hypothetical protein